jgi:hypothetical protein
VVSVAQNANEKVKAIVKTRVRTGRFMGTPEEMIRIPERYFEVMLSPRAAASGTASNSLLDAESTIRACLDEECPEFGRTCPDLLSCLPLTEPQTLYFSSRFATHRTECHPSSKLIGNSSAIDPEKRREVISRVDCRKIGNRGLTRQQHAWNHRNSKIANSKIGRSPRGELLRSSSPAPGHGGRGSVG